MKCFAANSRLDKDECLTSMIMKIAHNIKSLLLLAALTSVLSACRQDMHDQPKLEPLEKNNFFADQRASRPLVEGTVARGQLRIDEHFYTGKVNGELVTTLPFAATKEVLERGRERYNIFCAPCHDRVGSGNGMIVQRGFRKPPSFHLERLREMPIGHYFDVMTNGFGTMYSYSDRISPKDRWAIAAYIRVLQLSQNAALTDVPQEQRRKLTENK
jgi:mono/diheme cytochrome c family protein